MKERRAKRKKSEKTQLLLNIRSVVSASPVTVQKTVASVKRAKERTGNSASIECASTLSLRCEKQTQSIYLHQHNVLFATTAKESRNAAE